jgi:transposase
MQKIRECIYRLRLKHSLRQIHRDLGVHRSILRNIRNTAYLHGWLDPIQPIPDDYQIHQIFDGQAKARGSIFEPYQDLIKEWRDSGYSAVVIHKLLTEKLKCSLSQVRRYLKQTFPKQIDPVMVRQTSPGDAMDVDFGFLGLFYDPIRKCSRKTWIFSARLRHSRRAYREVVFDQNVVTFISCHIHAFEWFGGVPARIVLDNLKAGVIKSCIDNDQLNQTYKQMAEYYQVLLDPCLPNTPEHKGGVENDIGYIKKNFLPFIKEKKKHQPHIDLKILQEEVEKWNREIADQRILYGIGRSPAVIFAEEEKKLLKPLPQSRWDIVEWHQCEVRRDWRIMYDSSYYSVPFFLIGQTIQVMSTASQVRIFFEHNQVAAHPRAKQKWEYLRNSDHAPPFKEAILACTREGLLEQSQEIGPWTNELVQKIINDPAVNKLHPVRKLLALALPYEKERIEAACKRALHYKTFRYQSVKDILENGLDQEPIPKKQSKIYPLFRHARDPREYKINKKTEEVICGRNDIH